MSNLIVKVELEDQTTSDPLDITQLYTPSTPDVVTLELTSVEYEAELHELRSLYSKFQKYRDQSFLVYEYQSPQDLQQLYTPSTPDVVSLDFTSVVYAVVPFFPAADEIDPGVTGFAGDAGAYIG